MDTVTVLQSVFNAIQSGSLINASDVLGQNATQAPLPLTSLSPLQLPRLVYQVMSASVVRDWLKLFFIGAVLEICRRTFTRIWAYINDYFWISVTLDESDDCGYWLMFWLSKHKVFRTARTLDVSTRSFGIDASIISDSSATDSDSKGRKISFLPSVDTDYSLWYRYHYMTVTRTEKNDGHWQTKHSLHVSIFARNHNVLRDLLVEAKKLYYNESKNMISIYVSDSSDYWKVMCTQAKRPMRSIILDPGIIDLVLNDARDFLASKEWYAERGIPHRRGYLLYGAPGSGKTSLIHSIAGELNLDVYILSLTRLGLDDASLNSTIAELPKECIVLIEDVDAAFHRGIKRDIADPEKQSQSLKDGPENEQKPSVDKAGEAAARITLSGLLNALDGIGAQEGRIFFATTNDYKALDSALCRPGRLDLHIEFKLASKYQCRELFRRFYLPSSSAATAAKEQEEERERERADEKDSGYGSRTESIEGKCDPASGSPGLSAPSEDSEASGIHGMAHVARAPKLSHKQAAELADQFAAAVPHRSFSMATLQGYLMTYKTRPYDAVADLPAWVEKTLLEKKAGARSDTPAEPQRSAPAEKSGDDAPARTTESSEGGGEMAAVGSVSMDADAPAAAP